MAAASRAGAASRRWRALYNVLRLPSASLGLRLVSQNAAPQGETQLSGASAERPFAPLARSRRLVARVERVDGTRRRGAGGPMQPLKAMAKHPLLHAEAVQNQCKLQFCD